jgi:hypothetical protein
VAAHVVGSAVGQISPREFLRQVRAGRPVAREIGARYWWDGMNEVQVRERADLTGDELIAEWVGNADRARAARTRLPRPIARLPLLNLPAPVGRQSIAYLFDIGFTRDVWAHRMDIATATGRPMDLDAGIPGYTTAVMHNYDLDTTMIVLVNSDIPLPGDKGPEPAPAVQKALAQALPGA